MFTRQLYFGKYWNIHLIIPIYSGTFFIFLIQTNNRQQVIVSIHTLCYNLPLENCFVNGHRNFISNKFIYIICTKGANVLILMDFFFIHWLNIAVQSPNMFPLKNSPLWSFFCDLFTLFSSIIFLLRDPTWTLSITKLLFFWDSHWV